MLKELVLLSLALLSGHIQGGKAAQSEYWVSALRGGEIAAFNPDPNGYRVFRNIRDYGARGDGVTDDTDAINRAITEGNRCGPGCPSSTVSPAIIYFPAGNYLVSRPLLQYYYTQFIGDALNLPTLIMAPNFQGLGLINSNDYLNGPDEAWQNQNNFYRQVRNFNIDMTRAPANQELHGIHWQVAQATSITNVHVRMPQNSQHHGLWMENGSGLFFSDLTFDGGRYGLWMGNQQFTSRNLRITNADTAIYINWVWGWTFKNIEIDNCRTGLDFSGTDGNGVTAGSVLIFDSTISNTDVAVRTAKSESSTPTSAGTLYLDNVRFNNVNQGVLHTSGQVLLSGGTKTVQSWAQGHVYNRDGSFSYRASDLPAPNKSPVLLDNDGNFFTRPKPMYTDNDLSDFVNIKNEGAQGNGNADDTRAIQDAINRYANQNKIIYFPHGHYIVTDTIYVPPGSKLVGQLWSTIMARGNNFADANNPRPVIKVGNPGETGSAELSEFILTTSGPTPGAILLQINLRGNDKGSVGLWDFHFRVGGARGTSLEDEQCARGGPVRNECLGAFLLLHLAETSSALIENSWVWVADHDLDGVGQISIYNGRGVLIESTDGPNWLYGTSSEHSTLYQYNLANTRNVIMSAIQTETPYYQASPPAPQPWTPNAQYHDPDFSHCPGGSVTCPNAYGLQITNSDSVYVYGAGLYNFFQNYDQGCLDSEHCQDTMVRLQQIGNSVYIYNLNTKAADTMVEIDGQARVKQGDNRSTFCSAIIALIP